MIAAYIMIVLIPYFFVVVSLVPLVILVLFDRRSKIFSDRLFAMFGQAFFWILFDLLAIAILIVFGYSTSTSALVISILLSPLLLIKAMLYSLTLPSTPLQLRGRIFIIVFLAQMLFLVLANAGFYYYFIYSAPFYSNPVIYRGSATIGKKGSIFKLSKDNKWEKVVALPGGDMASKMASGQSRLYIAAVHREVYLNGISYSPKLFQFDNKGLKNIEVPIICPGGISEYNFDIDVSNNIIFLMMDCLDPVAMMEPTTIFILSKDVLIRLDKNLPNDPLEFESLPFYYKGKWYALTHENVVHFELDVDLSKEPVKNYVKILTKSVRGRHRPFCILKDRLYLVLGSTIFMLDETGEWKLVHHMKKDFSSGYDHEHENVIQAITTDGEALILSTNNGLIRFDPSKEADEEVPLPMPSEFDAIEIKSIDYINGTLILVDEKSVRSLVGGQWQQY